jgi:hypothetical protein
MFASEEIVALVGWRFIEGALFCCLAKQQTNSLAAKQPLLNKQHYDQQHFFPPLPTSSRLRVPKGCGYPVGDVICCFNSHPNSLTSSNHG